MAESIRMSYRQMRTVATDVIRQAEQARQVIDILEQDVARLLPTWSGASREAFESTYSVCREELMQVPEMLDQVGLALKQAADLVEQAEQQSAGEMSSTVTADNS
jgi:WXG100 family type VII secretion target